MGLRHTNFSHGLSFWVDLEKCGGVQCACEVHTICLDGVVWVLCGFCVLGECVVLVWCGLGGESVPIRCGYYAGTILMICEYCADTVSVLCGCCVEVREVDGFPVRHFVLRISCLSSLNLVL